MQNKKLLSESEQIGFLLKTITKVLGNSQKQILSGIGLNITQIELLGYLKMRRDEEVCQADIQNVLLLSNPAVTKLVRQLSEKDLLRVSVNAKDQRVRNLVITDKGLSVLAQCDKVKEPLQLHTLDGFSEQEIKNLKDYLSRLVKNIG